MAMRLSPMAVAISASSGLLLRTSMLSHDGDSVGGGCGRLARGIVCGSNHSG